MNNAIFDPAPAPQAVRNTTYAGVLTECSRILRRHVHAAILAHHETLTVEIDTLCRETYDAFESDKFGELRRVLRQSGDTLPREFANALERLMGQHASRSPNEERTYRAQRFTDVVLSLVDDMVFSESLLIGTCARQLHTACESELRELMPRIAVLLGVEGEVEEHCNPLSVDVIAEALKEACWSLDCGLQARQTLLEMVTARVAGDLPAAYRAIHKHLVDRKVLPRVRPSVRRGGRPEQARSQRSPEAAGMLRRLVGQEVAAVGATLQHEAANDAIIHALSRLQEGQGGFQLGGQQFSIDPSATESVNVVRVLLDAGLNHQVGTLDGIIIDVVATLFDFIFDDDRVPALMKALIGRMQLPVLKLALSDHSFFSDRQHPARRLINTLAQSAATWDGELTKDSSLYLIAEPLVLRIQGGGNDAAVFVTGLAALEAFLAEQERLADERAVAFADRLTEREIAEIARSVAIGTVAPHLADRSLPDAIRAVLDTRWTTVLAEAAREGGESGDRWIEAVSTMDELVWSVRPKTSAQERQRLVGLLPGLISRLKQGLDSCGMPESERSEFFSELVKLHANAVKNGMQLAVNSSWQPASAATAQDESLIDDGLDELKRGDWLELVLEGGQRRAVRLAWISPARTMFLFANRQGVRAVALVRSELARKFERDEALMIDDEPLMDRLVANVLDDYQPLAEGMSP